jgi:toxin HigB-1
MIRSFRHKGLERFFLTGSKAGIQPAHAAKLRRQLGVLNEASGPQAMGVPGWRLHPLTGSLAGQWAVTVDRTWRVTFTFDGTDAVLVDYRDYH